jgi:ketosteroid isomerase-like protein
VKPEEMPDAYVAAVRAKDVDAFLALYAEDVRTFDLWSVWTYDGKDALREMVEEWFGSPQTSPQIAV